MPDFTGLLKKSNIKKSLIVLGFYAFFASQPAVADHDHAHESHTAENANHVDAHTAENHAEHSKEEKFDAGKMILEHVKDAHDWHLWGHTSIPLPIIVYTKSQGLSIFSSSKFNHGHDSYLGFKLNEGNKIIWEDKNNTEKIYDISITKNVVSLFVGAALLLIVFLSIAKAYRKRDGKAPKGIQSLLEPIILFVRDDVAKASIGEKYERFLPLILTIFFFIFFNNLLGLIPIFPGGANLTGNIAVTMVLAVIVFLVVNINGNSYYWKHIFLPDVPLLMYIIIIPIEILGLILKPFVLMLRLFANITAGHIIILGFFSLIFIFGEMSKGAGYGASIFSVAFTLFMSMLELLVAFLQAFVFSLLTSLYIGMAVEEHHHAEDHTTAAAH